jgi:hypothetical protein
MTADDLDALEALKRRLQHTAAIAGLIARGASVKQRDALIAFEGIADQLELLVENVAAILRYAADG